MAEETKSPKKYRGYFVQRSYPFEHHDKDGNVTSDETVAAWCKRIETEWRAVSGVEYFMMIAHDKDVLDDGNMKPVHIHGWFYFKNPKTVTAAMKALGTSSEQNTQPIRNRVQTARYLTHISEDAINKDKHRYSKDAVICVNCEYEKLVVSTPKNQDGVDLKAVEDRVNHLATLVQRGEMTPTAADSQIDEDYDEYAQTIHRKYRGAFRDARERYGKQKQARMMRDGRNLQTVYIGGAGRIGKTRLAEGMAKLLSDDKADHTFHKSAANGDDLTSDPFGQYHYENVSVFNEANPTVFNLRQFLDAFEPYTVSSTNARNADKYWLAEHAFITYTLDWREWCHDLLQYTKGASDRYARRYTDGKPVTDSFGKTKMDGNLWNNANFKSDFVQIAGRFAARVEVTGDRDKHTACADVWVRNEECTDVNVHVGTADCDDVTDDAAVEQWSKAVLALINGGQPESREKVLADMQALSQSVIGGLVAQGDLDTALSQLKTRAHALGIPTRPDCGDEPDVFLDTWKKLVGIA